MGLRRYFWGVGICITQGVNALLAGYPDESLSSRAHRMQTKAHGWFVTRNVINMIFFWQPDHCKQAFEAERARRHVPFDLR